MKKMTLSLLAVFLLAALPALAAGPANQDQGKTDQACSAACAAACRDAAAGGMHSDMPAMHEHARQVDENSQLRSKLFDANDCSDANSAYYAEIFRYMDDLGFDG